MKILYISVETSARELEAKLLIAYEAILRGYVVYIGHHSKLLRFARNLGMGIVLHKDATRPIKSIFSDLKRKGIAICVHDEEGFIHIDNEVYMNARLRSDSIKFVDCFFAWGANQAGLISKVCHEYQSTAQIHVTGHPRIDILQNPIRKCLYGDDFNQNTILINTKLAECNHRSGPNGWIDLLEKAGILHSDRERERRYAQKAYKQKIFESYKEMILHLSRQYSDHNIVLRPHPSEDKGTWIQFCKNMPNVTVSWAHSIGYWLSRAKVVIHTGCTTGVEAAVAGVPVISFKPYADSRFDSSLPDKVSQIAYTPNEIVSLIRNIKVRGVQCNMEKISDHLMISTDEFAYMKILDVISDVPYKGKRLFRPREFYAKAIHEAYTSLVKASKYIINTVSNKINISSSDYDLSKKNYYNNKYPKYDVSIEETRSILRKYSRCKDEREFIVKEIVSGIYKIY